MTHQAQPPNDPAQHAAEIIVSFIYRSFSAVWVVVKVLYMILAMLYGRAAAVLADPELQRMVIGAYNRRGSARSSARTNS